MHEDLRRRALESTKTVSRKARSKQASANTSRLSSGLNSGANSSAGSRVASRDTSDDEGDDNDYDSDAGAWSTTSIDAAISTGINWEDELATRISRILDRNRKGGSQAGREEDLSYYVSILRGRYAQRQIAFQLTELYTAFVKYLKADSSERETLLALAAIAITTITDPNTHPGLAYEACGKQLQTLISDTESVPVKAEAILALSLVAFFSSDEDAIEHQLMPLLVSIIESDGAEVSADDSHEVVVAAIEAWDFLATLLDDAQDASEEIIEALVDQLSSTQTTVQIAAGNATALIYEKSYTDVESDEELSGDDADDDLKPGKPVLAPMMQRYQPYRRKDELLATVASLSKVSTKSRSRKDRKDLHAAFADVYQSIEEPRLGPRFSNALDPDTNQPLGSRMSIKVGASTRMMIDKWWKLARLRMLRTWLKGGFLEHHRNNEVVLEMLPVLTR